MSTETRSAIRRSLSEMLFTIFMRMMAVGCFYFGIRYWDLVIGFTSHGAIRFDVLSVPWRTVSACLAVLYPIIALGLWIGASWGVVLWAVAAGAEILMHTVWKHVYGSGDTVILMHVSVAALYVFFRIVLFVEHRRNARRVTLDLL